MKYIAFISLLIASCGQPPKPTPSPLKIESSILRDHDSVVAKETASVNQVGKWTLDSTLAYIRVAERCRRLDDSAKNVYISYAQGRATYEAYKQAHRRYEHYFFTVYQPFLKRLKDNSN